MTTVAVLGLGEAGGELARDLVDAGHAVRRAEEMASATELLRTLGVPPRISAASRDWLRDLSTETSAPRPGDRRYDRA